MGSIGNRLHSLIEPFPAGMIDHQGQDQGEGKTHQELIKTQNHRVPQKFLEHIGTEKPLKIKEPYPGAFHDTPGNIIALKGDKNSVQGNIVEYQEKGRCGKDKQIKLPFVFEEKPRQETVPMNFHNQLYK
jgi:hypothetical protein